MKPDFAQWSYKNHRRGVAVLAAGIMGWSLVGHPAAAVRFADGTVQFAGVPRLGKVSATDNQAWAWGATYLFTLQVPEDASEPLGQVMLQQAEGVDTVEFNLKRTYAYLNGDRRQTATVEAVNVNPDTLELTFNPPILPGSTLTIGLRPYNNPNTGGVYLFGVTAAPVGEKVRSQFIGYGRLQFYDRSFWRGFW
ncbi:DUF2808 domain-containing protein [Altericista sp. CCNU0014]|uniref:DUF2808 domain-containing protein n=1 Tax=Altericista sp. CCNU0014 TaxID=3082949 RepID=UPI00384AEC69